VVVVAATTAVEKFDVSPMSCVAVGMMRALAAAAAPEVTDGPAGAGEDGEGWGVVQRPSTEQPVPHIQPTASGTSPPVSSLTEPLGRQGHLLGCPLDVVTVARVRVDKNEASGRRILG